MKYCLFLFFVILAIGCHRPMRDPHLVDPIYLAMKKDLDKLKNQMTSTQKELEKAKTDYENAPIRTGQRQDAQEDYFELSNKMDRLIERYRYLSIRLETQTKVDAKDYQEAFSAKKPWPDPEKLAAQEAERRLLAAPKEWDPENRIKSRKPASNPTKSENASEHGSSH